MSGEARRRRWRELVEEHRQALAEFQATAESLPEERWEEPRAPGKWSPSQIVEHLRLTCRTIQSELEGRGGMRVRTSWLRQRVLRLLLVPRILRSRTFPEGAPAVRELRPQSEARYDRRPTLDALREQAASLVAAMAAADPGSVAVTHPFFGKLDPLQGLELATLHVQHHRAQLQDVTGRPHPGSPALAPVTTAP